MAIDRERRDQLADALHAFIIGHISNYEFEDAKDVAMRGSDQLYDAAISKIWYASYFLHDDHPEYRLVGRRRHPRRGHASVLRWILFLRSNCEFRWPSRPDPRPGLCGELDAFAELVATLFANILTLGAWSRYKRAALAKIGDVEVWPFLTRDEHDAAAKAACPFETIRRQIRNHKDD